jgi:hypothetical protein
MNYELTQLGYTGNMRLIDDTLEDEYERIIFYFNTHRMDATFTLTEKNGCFHISDLTYAFWHKSSNASRL